MNLLALLFAIVAVSYAAGSYENASPKQKRSYGYYDYDTSLLPYAYSAYSPVQYDFPYYQTPLAYSYPATSYAHITKVHYPSTPYVYSAPIPYSFGSPYSTIW